MAYKTIHTNYGLQKIAEAEAAGTTIKLVQMGVGDGNGNDVQPDPAQSFLARERYRAPLNQLKVDPTLQTRFIAELIVPATEGGFTIREVGLYDEAGKLFAVGNVPATYKPTPSEGAFSDTVVRMVFIVGNASVVQLVVDPNVVVATQSWVVNNITAEMVIPGGLTGQLLSKKSNADGDTEWIDPTAGFTVVVWSREETQTLADGQVNVDLAVLTTEGAAVYIEGTRLRGDEFSIASATRIVLASPHPAGAKVTIVQNEEVGKTEVLLRAQNLDDVLDKSAARNNLGLPNWLQDQQIRWAKLVNIPAFASRWPTFAEVTDKPNTYPPSGHGHGWGDISGAPETATRWPTWNEVSSKPSTFTPSAHSHAEYARYTDFQGANQALGQNGFQRLPGGLMMQWGRASVPRDGAAGVLFPTAFPNACLNVQATLGEAFDHQTDAGCSAYNWDRNGVILMNGVARAMWVNWFAIGY